MIDKGSEGMLLVPIKMYDVESRAASKYQGGNHENFFTVMPIAQEVIVQTKGMGESESTQTEEYSRSIKKVEKKVVSKVGEGSTRNHRCSKPLRDLIEELGTFASDEDAPKSGDSEPRRDSESEREGSFVADVKGTASRNQMGNHYQIIESAGISSDPHNIAYKKNTNQNSTEMSTTEKLFIFDEVTGKYKCSECGKLFKTTKSHMKASCSNPKAIDVDSYFDAETQKYRCDVCNKTFTVKTSFTNHKRNICNVAPQHECIFCDFKGRSPIVVRVHCGKKHGKWPRLLRSGQWIYE